MIRIPCSMLEQVRKSPAAHAQLLATGDKPKNGGTHGMFAYWQDVAKLIKSKGLSINEGVKELQNKFSRFDDTLKNRAKHAKLLDQLVEYSAQYQKMKLEFAETKHQIKWELIPTVMLTGYTPWVVYDDVFYYAYIVVEQPIAWQEELRFPLFQRYLATHILECDEAEIKVGTYILSNGNFDLKSFSETQINIAVAEVSSLFQTVHDEYNKRKK